MCEVMIFVENQWSGFDRLVGQRPDLRITSAQARYLVEFLRNKSTELVQNAGPVRKAVAVVGQAVIPLVINDGNANDCYLISPYVHYIAYMKLEVKKMHPIWMSRVIRACLTILGILARPLQFDKVVSINNWFFTTSMLNNLNDEEIRGLKGLLRQHFPDHAWVYREFERSDTGTGLAETLSKNGFQHLVHRPVFKWDPRGYQEKKFKSRIRAQIKRDLSLTERGPYSVRHARKGASTELAARFYEDLYIRKHSRFNAHFTSKFFDAVLSTKINRLSFLERDGRTVGFLTTCLDSDRLVASLVGYDRSADQPRASPYSAAFGEVFRQSLNSGKTLFLSTGVAAFKKRRGAHESMAYEAFEVSHLRLLRRLPWYGIKIFLDALVGSMDTGAI